jgi:hypothetical protein
MRFMIIRKADPETEAGVMPGLELLKAMGAYNQEMMDAGIFRDGAGLKDSSAGAEITFTDGEPTVTDGPFTEAKELVAGYTIIDVDSKEEAIEWLKRWPKLDGHGNARLELREMFELEDFDEEFQEIVRSQAEHFGN